MTATKPSIFKRGLSALLAVTTMLSSGVVGAFADTDDAVNITDENLRKAICTALNKSYSEGVTITEGEMAKLTTLDASNSDVTSIEGLQYAVNLENLNLSNTKIASSENTMQLEMYYLQKMPKLKTLNLSELGAYAYGNSWETIAVSYVAPTLPSLEELDLSDNGFSGPFYLSYLYDYKTLKKLDLSNNGITTLYKGGGSSLTDDYFGQIEKIDLSNNAIYLDESAEGYSGFVAVGIDKFDFSNQKNLSELKYVYVQPLSDTKMSNSSPKYECDENGVFDLGSVYGDTLTLSFGGKYCGTATTKAEINGEKYTVLNIQNREFNRDFSQVVLTGLANGEHSYSVSVMHVNGDTSTYTVKFRNEAIPVSDDENSAGITDPVVYTAVMAKLKNTDYTHVITKNEMAKLTGTLNLNNAGDINGVQYATKLTGLNVTSDCKELPDISGLVKLTTLQLYCPNVTKLPDMSAMTAIKTIKFSLGADSDWSVSHMKNLGTIQLGNDSTVNKLTMPTGTEKLSKLSRVNLYNYPDKSLEEKLGTYGPTIALYNCDKLKDLSAVSGMANVTINFNGTIGADIGTVKNVDSLSVTVTDVEEEIVLGAIDESTALTSFTKSGSANVDESKLLKSASKNVTSVSYSNFAIEEIPEEVYNLENLSSISIKDCKIEKLDNKIGNLTNLTKLLLDNTKISDLPEEAGKLQSLTTLYVKNSVFEEIPTVVFEMKNLNSMTFYISKLHSIEGNWDNLKNLQTLIITNGYVTDVPKNLKEATALKTIDLKHQLISSLDEDIFDGLDALTSVEVGSYVKVKQDEGSAWYYTIVDEDFLGAFNKLEEHNVKTDYNLCVSYAELKKLATSVGDIYFNYTGEDRNRTIYVPKGTTEFEFAAFPAKNDTEITYNGEKIKSGEKIKVSDLKTGNNNIVITTYNSFTSSEGMTNKPVTYNINVYVGDFIDESEFPTDKHTYMIEGNILQKSSEDVSMSAQYMSKYFKVKYVNGRFAVDLTVNKNGWLPSMRYMETDGTYVDAKKISEDIKNDTAVWRLYTDDITQSLYISPFVTPMGYSPVCRIVFDVNKITDITDTLPSVDFDELNIAINEALALTEKNNIYTDDSYSAFTKALEAAQKVAAEPLSSQEEIDAAEKALSDAMDALVIDENKLADKTALQTALETAKSVEKGKHTETAWNALQEAIADAQSVYDDIYATQAEVKAATKALNTAVTLFNASGDASQLDKNNLKDGTYSVYGEMIKVSRDEKSMSNDAINHYIKLTVEDGKYYLTMDFHGLAYLNKFGYLAKLSYYDNGYSYGEYGAVDGTLIKADVLSTQKNKDGSDLYDEFNEKGGSFEGNLYPDIIKFPLVSDALADEEGYIPLHVFVPVMEDITPGTGDQDVLLKLDWSTLTMTTDDDPNFDPVEPDELSPAIDYIDAATGVKVHADKGVLPEGAYITVTAVTSGSAYDNAVAVLGDDAKNAKLYEVKFFDKDGNEVKPNGTVSITFPSNDENTTIYRVADDSKVLVKGIFADNAYTVITKTGGIYAEVLTASVDPEGPAKPGDSDNPLNPGTGVTVGFAAVVPALCAGAAMIAAKKRRNKKGE